MSSKWYNINTYIHFTALDHFDFEIYLFLYNLYMILAILNRSQRPFNEEC